jgi:hypothetical protein
LLISLSNYYNSARFYFIIKMPLREDGGLNDQLKQQGGTKPLPEIVL